MSKTTYRTKDEIAKLVQPFIDRRQPEAYRLVTKEVWFSKGLNAWGVSVDFDREEVVERTSQGALPTSKTKLSKLSRMKTSKSTYTLACTGKTKDPTLARPTAGEVHMERFEYV